MLGLSFGKFIHFFAPRPDFLRTSIQWRVWRTASRPRQESVFLFRIVPLHDFAVSYECQFVSACLHAPRWQACRFSCAASSNLSPDKPGNNTRRTCIERSIGAWDPAMLRRHIVRSCWAWLFCWSRVESVIPYRMDRENKKRLVPYQVYLFSFYNQRMRSQCGLASPSAINISIW